MTLNEVLACFPNIGDGDWEDSYLADGVQRLLAASGSFRVEIILEKMIQRIAFFYDEVGREIFSCVDLVTKDTEASLNFLRTGALYVVSNPNTKYRQEFGKFEIEMMQVQTTDAVARSLIIRPLLEQE